LTDLKGGKGSKVLKVYKGSQGEQGTQGLQGSQGEQGLQGLQGDKGDNGTVDYSLITADVNKATTELFNSIDLEKLKGEKGDPGAKGDAGLPGKDGADGADAKLDYEFIKKELASLFEEWKANLGDLTGKQGERGEKGNDGLNGFAAAFPWKDTYCNLEGFNGVNFKNYAVTGTPTMFVLDSKGVILKKIATIEQLLTWSEKL
jgi:hypothetical protein